MEWSIRCASLHKPIYTNIQKRETFKDLDYFVTLILCLVVKKPPGNNNINRVFRGSSDKYLGDLRRENGRRMNRNLYLNLRKNCQDKNGEEDSEAAYKHFFGFRFQFVCLLLWKIGALRSNKLGEEVRITLPFCEGILTAKSLPHFQFYNFIGH